MIMFLVGFIIATLIDLVTIIVFRDEVVDLLRRLR